MKYNSQKIAMLSILMMFTIMVAAPGSASAQGTLEFSMSRDFGTGLGTSIEGLFTILGLKNTSNGLIWAPESIPALGANTTAIGLIFNSIFFGFFTMILSSFFGVLSIYAIRR